MDFVTRRALEEFARRIDQLEERMSQEQTDIDALTGLVTTAVTNITAEISNLEAQLAADQPPDLTALKAAVATLEDIGTPPPAPAPTTVPPATTPPPA